MKIQNVKINGLCSPIGFDLSHLTVSWTVTGCTARRQRQSRVRIAADPKMKQVLAEKEGCLPCAGVALRPQLSPRSIYYVQVSVCAGDGETAGSGPIPFETGKMDEPWQAQWIGTSADDTFHPVFYKQILLKASVRRARLYITGLGLYRAALNGRWIGEDHLAPFFNAYNCAVQVQTYDVTDLLVGDNHLTVMLGNGWYKGRLGYEGASAVYGDRFALLAELHILYTNGAEDVIGTDRSWLYTASQVTASDIYDGETIDRLQSPGAPQPALPLPGYHGKPLTDRFSPPLKEMELLPVREVLHTPAGETVLDFGQNFSGYVRFHAALPSGTQVILEHGEVLQDGNFYHDNYRTAKTEIRYTSDGHEEWVSPSFTYCGFRYVRLTGWPGEPDPADFTGVALYSAMDRIGWLETGHPKVNRLISNALWGLKSNFLDMPTDCPQRDERLGWTGDAQVFAPTASFFMDTRAFYRKFLWDMRNDQQLRDGAVAHYLPNITGQPGGSSVWGDAATFIPATLYQAFGGREALAESWPLMRDWVEWIRRGDRARGEKHLFDFAFTFGDWLAMDGVTEQSFKGGTEDAFISSVYYHASAAKLAEAAKALGYDSEYEDYSRLAGDIRQAILHEYFTPAGRLAMDTQAAYVIALHFGIYREKQPLIAGLRARLKKDGYRIRCGFVGAPLLCETLADNGMPELALRIFLQEDFPGWLHCVDLGATTIWERWNSLLDDGHISGTGMNSLNHYAYGSVIHYVVRHIAGLQPLEPGFARVRFAPHPDIRLGHAGCTYHSVSGAYAISWRIRPDGGVDVHCEVPFDCTAELLLPDGSVCQLEAGSFDFSCRGARDYTQLLGWDSLLEDCAALPQAMEILQQELPAAYGMALSGDRESLSHSLAELGQMEWFGFSQDQVDRAAQKLFALRATLDEYPDAGV